jgi:hypothetical protein
MQLASSGPSLIVGPLLPVVVVVVVRSSYNKFN